MSSEALAISKLFHIQNKDGIEVPFELNDAQRFLDRHDQPQGRLRLIIAKARQKGFSSIILAKFTIRCLTKGRGTHASVISHESEATQRLLDRVHYYLNHMNGPAPLYGRNSRGELYFPKTESTYYIGTAGSKTFGRGDWITDLHCCIHPDTFVLNNNKAVPIKEVGVPTLINYSGKVIKIVLWMCPAEGLILTPEHKVLTQRGLVRADELTLSDKLVYKKRPLTQTLTEIAGMDRVRVKRGIGAGKGSSWKNEPFAIPLTYEFGRVCGLYLAEGSLCTRCISFALHKKETDLVSWLSQYFGENGIHIKHRKADNGIEVYVKGIKWFHTFSSHFGGGKTKHLPDWVFNAPIEFNLGLIEGLFRGDGWHYFCGECAVQVCISQVRSQIIFQLRDLLCSLGFGFGSVKCRYSYKNQKNLLWELVLLGDGARKLITLLHGIETPEGKGKGTPRFTEKETEVFIDIKSIEEKEVENITFYDLLNQPEGLIKTPYGLISNSEYAHWQDPIKHTAGLFQAVPHNGRIYIESTGNGRNNDFYYMWSNAEAMGYTRAFYAWFYDDEYELDLPANKTSWKPDTPKHNGYLADLQKRFGLSDRKMWWYETKLREMREDLRLMQQEYPSEPEECFQATGGSIFDNVQLSVSPSWIADRSFGLYVYKLADHPQPNLHYVFGADPSGGTGNDDAAIVGICCETAEQVFELANNTINPINFGRLLVEIGKTYNEAYIVCEGNNHGAAVIPYLKENYPRHLLYKSKLETKTTPPRYGWYNTSLTKHALVGLMQEQLDQITLYGIQTVKELKGFEEDAEGRMVGRSDNLVIATGLAMLGFKRFEHFRKQYMKPKVVVTKEKPNYMVYTLDEILANITQRKYLTRGMFGPQVGQGYPYA